LLTCLHEERRVRARQAADELLARKKFEPSATIPPFSAASFKEHADAFVSDIVSPKLGNSLEKTKLTRPDHFRRRPPSPSPEFSSRKLKVPADDDHINDSGRTNNNKKRSGQLDKLLALLNQADVGFADDRNDVNADDHDTSAPTYQSRIFR
jgi:hypothetical protein